MNPIALLFAIQVCWTAPTHNVDESPLTDLDAYRIYYGVESRDYNASIYFNDPAATCHSWTPPEGTYFIAMTALDAEGNESAYSNEVLKTQSATDPGPDPAPMPPIMLTEDQTVYNVVKQQDRFVLLPVGTVPAGTSCDPNNSVNGHGAVPTEDVVWSSGATVRPIVVVAQCDG